MMETRMKDPKMNDRNGFTLVSVMIAIVLISVGLLGMFGTQVGSYSMQTHANARTGAVEVARAYMEDIKSRDPRTFGSLPVGGERVNEAGELDSDGHFVREVKVEPGGDHLKQISVLVEFPKATKAVKLVTLVYHQTF